MSKSILSNKSCLEYFSNLLALLLLTPSAVYATETDGAALGDRIAQIELKIVGRAPKEESIEQRLNTIETQLFGQTQSGGLFERLSKIQQRLAAASEDSTNTGDGWPAVGSVTAKDKASAAPQAKTNTTPLKTGSASETAGPLPGASTDTISKSSMASDSAASDQAVKPDSSLSDDGWPTLLPRFANPPAKMQAPLKIEVSETEDADNQIVQTLKHAPEAAVYKRAGKELADGHYDLAQKLYSLLSDRKPTDPRYFYGAGECYRLQGKIHDAFSNFTIAWHLNDSPVYTQAANALIPVIQREIDPTFKLTFGWQAGDPEVVLNAGVRCWKAGLTKQAVQLFEYALKNEPLYRGTAAYDLGAVAEYNGDLKLALKYYQWAGKENYRLATEAVKEPAYQAAIVRSLSLLPRDYIERAAADVQRDLLRGSADWNGWRQAAVHPAYWSSEVCPLCGISRTSNAYKSGQSTVE